VESDRSGLYQLPEGGERSPRGQSALVAIANVSDEAELHRMIVEMPFSPFSDHEIRPIVDPATGWRQAREALAAMMAST
jgi:muconolactone delta-isomerase